jgi:hypothetical protein
MPLNEAQTSRVWQLMVEAEVRSYYFGDLASRFTRQKQIITGLSFFLSSGAAATIAARLYWAPLISASIAAGLTAYSIAAGLDRRAGEMAQLHHDWAMLSSDYERLWHHWYEEDADSRLAEIQRRDGEVSRKSTEAPYDRSLLDKWQDRVNDLRGVTA